MASVPPSPTPTLLRPPSFHPVDWSAAGVQPRYVVINPMHIITLQDRTKTFAVRVVENIKSFSERWFSHVLLLLFLLIYATLGALLFQWLEWPLEHEEKFSIIRSRELIIERLWQETNKSKEEWYNFAHKRMLDYERQVEQHFMSGAPQDSESTVWTFWGSLFYAGTIFTTIGYGNIVPATTAGQAVTIIYAFIGIPFLLMVLADLGRLFTRGIKAVFYYVKLFCRHGKIRKARRMGRRATAVPVQYMTVAWNKMPYLIYQNREKKGSPEIADPESQDPEAGINKSDETDSKETKENKELKDDVKEEEKADAEDVSSKKEERGDKEAVETTVEAVKTIDNSDVDDEFNLPVSLAILLLLAYMMLGAFMFTLWEKWSFFESFYFVFISMSTIGFGDYVPDHPAFMMATFIYLLFGLTLTSMCINVIQEKLSATFEMAKLRIGATIGLDANMLMDYDSYPEKGESPERKGEGNKSRRGSKAVPNKASEEKQEEKEEESHKTPENLKNDISERNSKNFLEPPAINHQ